MDKKGLNKGILIPIVIVIVLVALVFVFATFKLGGSNEKVKLDFYVMSQCPFGTQVEDAIKPVLDEIGDNIDFSLNFIGTEQVSGTFQSLHGQPEVLGDIVQLCAAKYDPDKYMNFVVCMNEDAQSIPNNWKACAEERGLNVKDIQACFDGQEGKDLLSASIKLSDEAKAGSSPTMYLNDKPYAGGRDMMSFYRAICDEFKEKPAKCNDLPKPVEVNLIILNDERCVECKQVSALVPQLKSLFPGLKVTTLDYASEEGKALYASSKLTTLPALLFDPTVEKGEGYDVLQRYLVPLGEYQSLQIGASFDPKKEICDNKIDDTSNGKIDCDDEDCKQAFVCREEKKNNLLVFIMSDCPFGKKAIEALKDFTDSVKGITYEVHYIASEATDGFESLHGQYEVDEDIVQLCVIKHSPDKFLSYAYCRSTKGIKGIDWNACAAEAKVDIAAVKACFEGTEGKALLKEDIKIASSLGIGSSPTWIANNKYQFSGIDAETVKQNMCQHNDLEGCDKTIQSSSTSEVPAGSCGG